MARLKAERPAGEESRMDADRTSRETNTPPSKPKAKRGLLFRLARVTVVVLAALAAIYISADITGCAERLFFYPSRSAFETPSGYEDVTFENDEGLKLHGWFLRAADAEPSEVRPVVVHCHGNAFNIGRHSEFVDFLPEAGVHVLIFDYRGYGRSDRGELRRDGLVSDALAALDYMRSRPDVDPDRVGLYGLSLGGTVALAAAAEDERVAAVCSVATFSTWRDVAGDFAPGVGPSLITDGRDAVDSVKFLGDRPLLLLHGEDDSIVGHRHVELIEASAADAGVDVRRRSFPGIGHVDWVEDSPEMRGEIVDFFRAQLVDR